MKTLEQLISYLKESEPSTLHLDGREINTLKHHDNDEMVRFLKSDEGKTHEFVGLDKHGKPHSASR